MPREQRDERRARNAETAQAWARWLKQALADHEPPLRPADLARMSNGAFGTGHTTKWTNADNTASPEHVLLIARLLNRDGIEALRAAGHHEIADYAAEMRRDPIGAVIRHELDAIEDDPHLHWLADERKRGTISDDEYKRMRADFLRRKQDSIQHMRLEYDNAVRRNAQTSDEPGSGGNGARAAL